MATGVAVLNATMLMAKSLILISLLMCPPPQHPIKGMRMSRVRVMSKGSGRLDMLLSR